MKKAMLMMLTMTCPMFALDVGLGIAGSAGIGYSRWKFNVYDEEGNHLATHLDSWEPVFGTGPSLSIWFTRNIGLKTGIQYARTRYNYTYDYASPSDAVELVWDYDNLVIPVALMAGVPSGNAKFLVGAGFTVVKQTSGRMGGGLIWGERDDVDPLPDSLLATKFVSNGIIGAEFRVRRFGLVPSLVYINGLHGLDRNLWADISTHHLIFNMDVFYYPFLSR